MSDHRTAPRHTGTNSPIARIRMERGLTQEQLGKLLGVDKRQVGFWERGVRNPNANSLRRLARALDCTMDELVDDGNNE